MGEINPWERLIHGRDYHEERIREVMRNRIFLGRVDDHEEITMMLSHEILIHGRVLPWDRMIRVMG